MRRSLVFCLFLSIIGAGGLGWSQPPAQVDLTLILLVDVSGSLSEPELALQRDGYRDAFTRPELASAIAFGQQRAIAVAYVEWAGPDHQAVVLPCRVLATRADVQAVSRDLATAPRTQGHGTSISAALSFAVRLAGTCPARSPRLVIDVSGNGPNNIGPDILAARDAAVAAGATINGLPIDLGETGGKGPQYGGGWLRDYYRSCVSGGQDAFVLPVDGPARLSYGILRKLVVEIAAETARLQVVRDLRPAYFDCHLIGQSPGR